MSQAYSERAVRIPRWLVWIGSIAIVLHLGAISANMLAAYSGPWAENEGRMVRPPLFAAKVAETFSPYSSSIRMNLNYHVFANHTPSNPGVYLEFRLKDDQGK